MGFLWFGTKDGLNRFDGYNFKVFRKTGKPGSIGNNFIHTIYEDKNGYLWIGTERGLYKYENLTESFSVIPGTENMGVSEITCDSEGSFWFIYGRGLVKYAATSGQLQIFETPAYFEATSVCTTPDGNLWISTANGLLERYDRTTASFTSYDLFESLSPPASRWIERITAMNNGLILIGTSVAGVKLFDPAKGKFRDIAVGKNQKDLFVRNFLQTGENEFWVGTEYGVYIHDLQTGNSTNLSKKYNDPFAISDNAVYTFCRDREGGTWVGTYFGGINYYPRKSTPFKKYFPKIGENSLSGNVVREIKEDKNGCLWIGTEDAGLNKLDTKTGMFTHYQTGGKKDIAYPNIHGLLVNGNELWIGTFEHGLDIMDIHTGMVVHHYDKSSEPGLKSNFIYCIAASRSGKIMIGTTIGAYYFNRETNDFDTMPGMPVYNWYTSILEDANGVIWAGTYGNGVNYFNPRTRERGTLSYDSARATSLRSDRINSIFEDSGKNLWFATEEGLSKWDPSVKGFVHYNVSNGFPSNYIISILEDSQSNLWVSTTKGLAKLDPKTGNVQVYSLSHGLLTDQFNFSSAYKDATGRMYFGSAKGMISFLPNEFGNNEVTPALYITGFQVNNEETNISDEDPILTKSISHTSKITLDHDQSTFSIDFAALSYTAPEMREYAYQLDGLSSNWTYIKGNRRIYFTELPPGTYTFRVKSSTSNGSWTKSETRLIIEINRPWWTSVLAFLIYATILIVVVIYIIRSANRRTAERNKRKLELLEIAKEKEILQAKIEFFTNVAHEIKTPLTLIKIPLAKVIKKTLGIVPEIENSLRIMDKNTNRLIELTQQLLDFRQTEINEFKLSFVRTNISELITDANKSFSSLAEQNNVSLLFNLPQNPVYAYVDAEAFNKIIYNLYSNAVKYADKKAEIVLFPLSQTDTTFTVLFKNDGYIIPDNLRDQIFQPFYRIKKTEGQNGTGIGLALSLSLTQLHKGTLELKKSIDKMNLFELSLPIHQEMEFNLKGADKNYI
jgi:ligand-binding sensor domain-containing protein/signal transduction histidine kinase